jgi:hypothetical protein
VKKVSYPALAVLIVVLLLTVVWYRNSQRSLNLNFNSEFNLPSQTQVSSTPIASPKPSFTPAKSLSLRLFFIALNDKGQHGEQVGCGDTIAPVEYVIPDTTTPLQTVLHQLLSIKQQNINSNLYNALSQSDLQLKDASIKDGLATVHLTGTLNLGGECDNPRVQAQLEKTILQFSNVKQAQIYINDKPLSEVLSLK